MSSYSNLASLLKEIRGCQLCHAHLPLGPKPTLRAQSSAKILIVGQAPGIKVHETGIPWNDASGDRLRQWMDIDRDHFYDEEKIAIIPMGFCYPGTGRFGDLPPRKECSEVWLPHLLKLLPHIQMTLLLGKYAQDYYLEARQKSNLTQTVRAWQEYAPRFLPLPHPSPRNNIWFKKNPWFELEVVPYLKRECRRWIK